MRRVGGAAIAAAVLTAIAADAVRVFPLCVSPSLHPNQQRSWTHPPPSLGPACGGEPAHWAGFRGGISNAALDAYNKSGFGDIVWPQYPVMANIEQTLPLLLNRTWLWLADISNYVPGDNSICDPPPPASVCEYHAPRAKIDLLVRSLGDRFTGMDNGEQDGRYISYATQQLRGHGAMPVGASSEAARGAARRESYLNFRRHFERIETDLGFRLMSLNSLWYPHYFAQAGYYTMLGAETAQGLPNDQLFYAFLRGAAKQYGTLVWGDASIGNRWWGPEGPKTCTAPAANATTCVCSEMGTSISLLRRLMYSQIMYGSAFMSFEGSLSCSTPSGATIPSPIGRVQQAGQAWAHGLGRGGLGVHLTTVAIMLDHFAGYTPPRHLYAGDVYRVWGGLPWDEGDFFTHGVLNILFPEYERSSYYHNESGFLTGTPHGDGVDVLLSSAPAWHYRQYPVVVIGTPLHSGRAEVVAKLEAYVASGGTAIVAASALASGATVLGVGVDARNASGGCMTLPAGTVVTVQPVDGGGSGAVTEPAPVNVCRIFAPAGAAAMATAPGASTPLAVRVRVGNGSLVVLASSGVTATPQTPLPIPEASGLTDKPLPNPHPLAAHARAIVDSVVASQAPFDVGPASAMVDGLAVVATRVKTGEYYVGVSNNGLSEQPFAISSRLGKVTDVTEVALADSWMNPTNTPGWWATHTPNGTDVGKSTSTTIAGLDFRIFSVAVDESSAEMISDATPPPLPAAGGPRGPRCVGLVLHGGRPLLEQVILRPTFSQHWDTVVLDWRVVESMTPSVLAEQGAWAFRQNMSIIVDFASGLNLYPDLRLCNNSVEEFKASVARIQSVIAKAAGTKVNASTASASTAAFSRDFIVSTHRAPENDYSAAQCLADFARSVSAFASTAAGFGATVHVRAGTDGKGLETLDAAREFVVAAGSAPNIKLAVGTAMLVGLGTPPSSINVSEVGLWLASAPIFDPYGSSGATPALLSNHGSLTSLNTANRAATSAILKLGGGQGAQRPAVPIVLDAALTPHDGTNLDALDEEWAEVAALEALLE